MKKLLSLLLAVAFTLSTASISVAASSVNCEVKSVDGNSVILDCGKDADELTVGSDVKVKKAKKRAIEGC